MKKRLLALMLAMAMVMGMSMTAFASETGETTTVVEKYEFSDATLTTNSFQLNKEYTIKNGETLSPAETFEFNIDQNPTVSNGGVGAVVGNIEVTAEEFPSSETTATKKLITVKLPAYKAVGVYTYKFTEKEGNTAGVNYDKNTYTVIVTVTQTYGTDGKPSGLTTTATVKIENEKADTIRNTYEAGSLSVSKEVKGNAADTNEYFPVTVTFNAPNGRTVKEDIVYTGGSYKNTENENDVAGYADERIAVEAGESGWTESKTVSINVKHGDTVTFKNIPYGVTYSVVETDAKEHTATYSGDTGTISNATAATVITNTKDVKVDTGIFTNNMPYILALVAIAAVAVVMFRRKREF